MERHRSRSEPQTVKIIKQYEKGIVESLGKYKKMAGSGLVFIIPFIENIIPVDMRELVINVEPQQVITKDNAIFLIIGIVWRNFMHHLKRDM